MEVSNNLYQLAILYSHFYSHVHGYTSHTLQKRLERNIFHMFIYNSHNLVTASDTQSESSFSSTNYSCYLAGYKKLISHYHSDKAVIPSRKRPHYATGPKDDTGAGWVLCPCIYQVLYIFKDL